MVAKGLISYKYRRRDLVDPLRQSSLDGLGYRSVRYHLGVVSRAILMKMNVLWIEPVDIRNIDLIGESNEICSGEIDNYYRRKLEGGGKVHESTVHTKIGVAPIHHFNRLGQGHVRSGFHVVKPKGPKTYLDKTYRIQEMIHYLLKRGSMLGVELPRTRMDTVSLNFCYRPNIEAEADGGSLVFRPRLGSKMGSRRRGVV